jgi:hypothetical protein
VPRKSESSETVVEVCRRQGTSRQSFRRRQQQYSRLDLADFFRTGSVLWCPEESLGLSIAKTGFASYLSEFSDGISAPNNWRKPSAGTPDTVIFYFLTESRARLYWSITHRSRNLNRQNITNLETYEKSTPSAMNRGHGA